MANEPVGQFALPANRIARVRLGMPKAEVLRLARRHGLSAVPVEEPLGRRKLIGYVRVVDLRLDSREDVLPVRPLLEINHKNKLYGWANKNGKTLEFETLNEKLENGRRLFTIAAVIDGKQIAEGKAFNKKDASQIAAQVAVEKMGIINSDSPVADNK